MREGLNIKIHMSGVDPDEVTFDRIRLVTEDGTKMLIEGDSHDIIVAEDGIVVYVISGVIDFFNEEEEYEDIEVEIFDRLSETEVSAIYFNYEENRPLGAICEKVELAIEHQSMTIIDLQSELFFEKEM